MRDSFDVFNKITEPHHSKLGEENILKRIYTVDTLSE